MLTPTGSHKQAVHVELGSRTQHAWPSCKGGNQNPPPGFHAGGCRPESPLSSFLDVLSHMSSLIRLGWWAGELQASTHLHLLSTEPTMPATVSGFWCTRWRSNSDYYVQTALYQWSHSSDTHLVLLTPSMGSSLCTPLTLLCSRSHINSCGSLRTWQSQSYMYA